jgi:hypothetical protein
METTSRPPEQATGTLFYENQAFPTKLDGGWGGGRGGTACLSARLLESVRPLTRRLAEEPLTVKVVMTIIQ